MFGAIIHTSTSAGYSIPSLPAFADNQMQPVGVLSLIAASLFITAIIKMMARDAKMSLVFFSAASLLVYALFAVLAWQDMATQTSMMTDAAYPLSAASWSAMPSIVFNGPLYLSLFFAACALYKNFKDHQK